MDPEKLQQNLMKFGLSKYETSVYITLLMRGSSTASEIVEASGIPQPRFYDIASSLEKRGLIISKGRRPKEYLPVDPEAAIPKLFSEFEESYRDALKSSRELYKKIPIVAEKPSVWIVRGKENVLTRMVDIQKGSKVETWAALPDFLIKKWEDLMIEKSSTGVSVSLVTYPMGEGIDFKTLAERIPIRTRKIPGMSMIVADNQKSMICSSKMLAPDFPSEFCYGVFMEENKELIQIMNDFFFFTLWQPSRPLGVPKPKKAMSFANVPTAIEYLKSLRGLKKEARVIVRGKHPKTKKSVTVRGRVGATQLERGGFRTMNLLTDAGELVRIGSLGATFEDVEAEKITITTS